MASAAVQRLEDIFTCSVCLSTVQNGKVLECQHSFCLTCIQAVHDKHISKNPSSTGQLPCPMCKVTSRIPNGGVTKLPNDLRTNEVAGVLEQLTAPPQYDEDVYRNCGICSKKKGREKAQFVCFDCIKMLCSSCLQKHNKNSQSSRHVYSRITSHDISSLVCEEHDEIVSLYCMTCREAVCNVCTLTSHDSHHHASFTKSKGVPNEVGLVVKEAQHKRTELVPQMETIQKTQQTYINAAKKTIEKHKEKVMKQLEEEERRFFKSMDNDYSEFESVYAQSNSDILDIFNRIHEIEIRNELIEKPLMAASDIRLDIDESSTSAEQIKSHIQKVHALQSNLPVPIEYQYNEANLGTATLKKVTHSSPWGRTMKSSEVGDDKESNYGPVSLSTSSQKNADPPTPQLVEVSVNLNHSTSQAPQQQSQAFIPQSYPQYQSRNRTPHVYGLQQQKAQVYPNYYAQPSQGCVAPQPHIWHGQPSVRMSANQNPSTAAKQNNCSTAKQEKAKIQITDPNTGLDVNLEEITGGRSKPSGTPPQSSASNSTGIPMEHVTYATGDQRTILSLIGRNGGKLLSVKDMEEYLKTSEVPTWRTQLWNGSDLKRDTAELTKEIEESLRKLVNARVKDLQKEQEIIILSQKRAGTLDTGQISQTGEQSPHESAEPKTSTGSSSTSHPTGDYGEKNHATDHENVRHQGNLTSTPGGRTKELQPSHEHNAASDKMADSNQLVEGRMQNVSTRGVAAGRVEKSKNLFPLGGEAGGHGDLGLGRGRARDEKDVPPGQAVRIPEPHKSDASPEQSIRLRQRNEELPADRKKMMEELSTSGRHTHAFTVFMDTGPSSRPKRQQNEELPADRQKMTEKLSTSSPHDQFDTEKSQTTQSVKKNVSDVRSGRDDYLDKSRTHHQQPNMKQNVVSPQSKPGNESYYGEEDDEDLQKPTFKARSSSQGKRSGDTHQREMAEDVTRKNMSGSKQWTPEGEALERERLAAYELTSPGSIHRQQPQDILLERERRAAYGEDNLDLKYGEQKDGIRIEDLMLEAERMATMADNIDETEVVKHMNPKSKRQEDWLLEAESKAAYGDGGYNHKLSDQQMEDISRQQLEAERRAVYGDHERTSIEEIKKNDKGHSLDKYIRMVDSGGPANEKDKRRGAESKIRPNRI